MDFNHPVTNFNSVGLDQPQNLPLIDGSHSQSLPQTHPEPNVDTHKPDPNQQAPNAAELAVMKEKINRLMKMDNLADITLAGYMIKLLRHRTKMSFRELHDEVSKCYDTLRRSDGSKYTGDLAKALKGCLTSSEIFKEVGDNVWGVREKEAKMYEEKTTKKLKTLINKKKGRSGRKKESDQGEEAGSDDDDLSGSDDESVADDTDKSMPVKKLKQTTGEYQKIFNILELSNKKVRANDNTANLIKNPFEGLSENDTLEEASKKIGGDRFIGILECFEFFSPLLQEYFKQNASIAAATANNSKKNKVEGSKTNGHDSASKASKGKK